MKPTLGELSCVARRRAGLTQAQVASLVARPQNAVARWEASKKGPPKRVWREAGLVMPHGLQPWEEAMLLRERLGLTIEQAREHFTRDDSGRLAKRNGAGLTGIVSHVAVLKVEHGEAMPHDVGVYLEVMEGLYESHSS